MAWTPPSDAVEASTTSDKGWTPPSDAVVASEPITTKQPAKEQGGWMEQAKAGGEAFVRNLPATGGFWAGSAAGAAAVAPYAAAVAPAAPVVAGAIELLGGLTGGVISAGAVDWATDKLSALMDPVGYAKWKQTQQQYPEATTVGGFAAGFAGSSWKTAPEIAGKLMSKPGVQRATSGALMGGFDATQQYLQTGTVDPKMVAASAVGGAVLPGANVAGRTAQKIGTKAVEAIRPTEKTTVSDIPPPPSDIATPEERTAYVEKLKEIKAKRDANAPIVEAAIKNKQTGEIERMGPKHDPQRKADTVDTHDQGFVTERGQFLTREEAVDHAKRTKQIPEDHVLENPPGEQPGLHSGDLRKAGDERFKVTEDQPAGKPKPPAEEAKGPVTRQEHKDAIDKLREERLVTLEIQKQEALNKGDKAGAAEIEAKQVELKQQQKDLQAAIPAVEFKNKALPTWDELHDHLWDSASVGHAFDKILAVDGLGTKGQRALLKVLNQSEFIRNAKLQFDKDYLKYTDPKDGKEKNAAGLYTGGDVHLVQIGKEGDIRVLAHEAMHAGTQKLIEQGSSAAAIKLKELQEKFVAEHERRYQEVLEQFQRDNIAPTIGELKAFEKANRKPYGLTNVHEFVSEAFTNKEFQQILASIKASEPQKGVLSNMWQEFKNVVREGLQIPEGERTAFDEAMEHGAALVEESKGFKREGTTPPLPSEIVDADKFKQDKVEEYQKKVWENYESWLGFMPSKLKETVLSFSKQAYTPLELVRLYNKDAAGFDPTINDIVDTISKTSKDPSLRGMAEDYLAGKKSGPTSVASLAEKTSEPVAEEFKKLDPRSMPSEEAMMNHATDIYERYGEAETIKFFEDYKKDLNERSIPVPNNLTQLDDALHKMNTFETKDRSEMVTWMDAAKAAGVTPETAEKWFFMLEDLRKLPDEATRSGATSSKIKYWESLIKEGKELPADAKKSAASYDSSGREISGSAEKKIKEWFDILEKGRELPPEAAEWLQEGRNELVALVRKAKGMGLDVGEEFVTGQSRIRLFSEQEKPGWKETLKKFFSNETPMGDKVAEQANAAIERKVYQTSDSRVIELHRQPEDTRIKLPDGSYREIKKGTEVWEWRDGKKRLLTHSPDLNLKRGDKIKVSKLLGELPEPPERTGSTKRTAEFEPTIIDGSVGDIEKHSPYRYLHDALASQAIARMGLRKMVREAELVDNLKKSEMFKQVGHGPEEDLKTLPKHWVVPSNIDRIPQLRGWHFDPKAAAIISDFAKVWDNGMYMKLTNALVKNMMLNPVPHIFNEAMHLWNARGFTGWVMPGRLGTLAETSRAAWRDVGNQTQFYRDIMREGGSILGADPRNKGYFEPIIKQASQEVFGTPEMQKSMGQLAKKLGTTVGDLYNGISTASNKAMWFTRDVMYVQLIREIMKQNPGWELKEAIAHAERHMPNYRLPSEVLGSRALSQVLRDPRVSMFSRYHYGMVKSLVNTIKDINPKNLSTPEGRANFREGVDSMVAIGVAMGIMYPLMDKLAEAMFGEGAEQRRAGPYHLIQAAMDVGAGKKDASALVWPVFTFNPMLLTLAQLGFNKKIFTGKPIYHPDDTAAQKASDVGKYLVGQVPQAAPVMSATSGEEGGATKLLARQLDIKAKTEKELAREKRAKELQTRAKKGRDTKREKDEYKP